MQSLAEAMTNSTNRRPNQTLNAPTAVTAGMKSQQIAWSSRLSINASIAAAFSTVVVTDEDGIGALAKTDLRASIRGMS